MQSKLSPSALQTGEFAKMVWVATAEAGTPIETVLDPMYWSHVAKTLKPWHEIDVRAGDGSWLVRLVVRDAGPMWAKVELLAAHEFEAKAGADVVMPAAAEGRYIVKWRFGAKWSVLRLGDNAVMIDGLATKDEAALWLTQHVAKVAA